MDFYTLLVNYDKTFGFKVPKEVAKIREGDFICADMINNFTLPEGVNYLLVTKSVPLEGDTIYEFRIFKVEKNYKKFIQGVQTDLAENMNKQAISFRSSIPKADLFSKAVTVVKGHLKETLKRDFCLCELPPMVELFEAQSLIK